MKKIKIIVLTVFLYFFVFTFQIVLVHKFVNPVITPLMIIRLAEGYMEDGNAVEIKQEWKSLDEMSVNVGYAVIASEDFNFFQHNGFDWRGIRRAFKYNLKHKGKKIRGGSTISQQTAKNVFLFPSRTWLRKGFETYFTFLIELLWSKERILEVYLNVIELGDGVYGIESGAQLYYKTSASELTAMQAASLVSIMPAPLERSPTKPTKLVKRKIGEIQIIMGLIQRRPLDFPIKSLMKE